MLSAVKAVGVELVKGVEQFHQPRHDPARRRAQFAQRVDRAPGDPGVVRRQFQKPIDDRTCRACVKSFGDAAECVCRGGAVAGVRRMRKPQEGRDDALPAAGGGADIAVG